MGAEEEEDDDSRQGLRFDRMKFAVLGGVIYRDGDRKRDKMVWIKV